MLQKCMAIYANEYLLNVVELLGEFFDESKLRTIKGLSCELELIQTFLLHNDRLQLLIENALYPFELEVTPKANLSVFLDFSILKRWFADALNISMTSGLHQVLSVWTDKEKNIMENIAKTCPVAKSLHPDLIQNVKFIYA
jgi:hypothetical protein